MFNYEAAKQAGYTDQEINAYLSKKAVNEPTGFLQGKTLPITGGVLGGLIGSLAGPVTGIAGAGAGYAGGDVIRKLLGGNQQQGLESVAQTGQEALEAAGGQAAGLGIAKGLGFLFNPIKPFINRVNTLLAKSPKTIDIANLLKKGRETIIPYFEKKTLGGEAKQAYNELAPNIVTATKARMSSPILQNLNAPKNLYPLSNYSPSGFSRQLIPSTTYEDIASLKLPISEANILKREITKPVQEYYGEFSQIDKETRKQLGRLLKEEIEKAEPGVKIPNKIASWIYKVPEAFTELTYALPWKTGLLLRHALSLPVKGLQRLFPYETGLRQGTLGTMLGQQFRDNEE